MTHTERVVDSELMNMRDMVYACTRCGYCREKYSSEGTHVPAFRVCPVREHSGGFEYHCARGKLLIAQGVLEGMVEYSQELANLVYGDPDCGLCTYVCNTQPLIDPVKVFRALRQDLASKGMMPVSLMDKDDNVKKNHNIFGSETARRSKWADDLNLPQRGDLVFFAGCYASYPSTGISKASIAILRKAGLNPAYLGESEWCCGVTQFHDGSKKLAKECAEHNIELIIKSGARKVVTSCAECYKSFKIEYPEIAGNLPFEIVHLSELVEQLLSSGNIYLKKQLDEKKVTYHDPCHLGRYCKIFEQPRKIIQAVPGLELVEMKRTGPYAWCCGHGAEMVSSVSPGLAMDIAKGRAEEAIETGAEAIITSCPRCALSLKKVSKGLKVYDLADVVMKSIG